MSKLETQLRYSSIIKKLRNSRASFEKIKDFRPNELFRNCFGIINPKNEKPEEIILSFTPLQGKYIKRFPLHHSQEIITNNEKELLIKLQLFITDDFIFELLSHGDMLKIISSKSLKNNLCKLYSNALKKNKNNT